MAIIPSFPTWHQTRVIRRNVCWVLGRGGSLTAAECVTCPCICRLCLSPLRSPDSRYHATLGHLTFTTLLLFHSQQHFRNIFDITKCHQDTYFDKFCINIEIIKKNFTAVPKYDPLHCSSLLCNKTVP